MSIIDFWKNNRNLWIPITERDKAFADKLIYDTYYTYDMHQEPVIGRVIYLDQFYRHFHRHLGIVDEQVIFEKRNMAVDFIRKNEHLLSEVDEIEFDFALMPFKHLGYYDYVLDAIYNKWSGGSITNYPILNKFHNDTYKKTYTLDKIRADICAEYGEVSLYDHSVICDFYPERYKTGDFGKITGDIPNEIIDKLKKIEYNEPIVSLSGGVDSMVILALLKNIGKNPIAVHIIYGNREVSRQEFHFISDYCRKLDVRLYSYTIQYLKRIQTERDFYETMTRDIRFNVYKALADNPVVLMGHIKDDIIENIWTNLANAKHLDNLKKMSYIENQNGVSIVRPFLEVNKSQIYEMSSLMAIPYLKNTTPIWSNRGKFREHFYMETHKQFGPSVDEKLIFVAETLERQSKLLERMIYKPIYDSFNLNRILITPAVQADLGIGEWTTIFEYICHNLLGHSKPSIHAIKEFKSKLDKAIHNKLEKCKIQLKKDFQVILEHMGDNWYLELVIL